MYFLFRRLVAINTEGFFNKGLKNSKYAYEIKQLYELEKAIPLKELKEKYGFNPPQSYAYDVRYEKLTEDINKMDAKRII